MIIVNNELYDANAVGEGGIPAVALAGAPDSPPALLVDAAGFCAGMLEVSAGTVEGAFSAAGVEDDVAGPCVDRKGLDEENWMPP